jgi:hypothetical protein
MQGRRDKHGDSGNGRTRARLGPTTKTAAGPNPYGRWLFLDAVARCVPDATRTLALVTDDAALHAWAAQWGFSDDWARRSAGLHVAFWRDHPAYVGRWMIGSFTPTWEPVFPAGPSFNPTTETEAAFRSRVDAYVATCLAAPGLTTTPEKETVTHFEWLALHHVGKRKYEYLAARYGDRNGYPDIPAISRAIHDTAAMIGLTLRPGRGRKLSPAP